jgi:diguanylate cyclase (GGDEF)-like protein/PAS domain S-box-containing protein
MKHAGQADKMVMRGPVLEAKFRLELTDRLPVLSVSDGIMALLGFTAEAFLSSRVSLRERIHKDDCDVAGMLFSPENHPACGDFNIRLRHADGRIRCVRGQYSKQTSGGVVTLDLLLQDAKSLYKSSDGEAVTASFRTMMDNTDDYIYFKDRNYVYTAGSRNLMTRSNPVPHEIDVLGQTDYDVYPEASADIYYRLEKQVFASVSVASEVHEGRTVDGKLAWLDSHKYPIKNDKGEIIGLFGVARDVTEHMKAQQTLRESEESLLEAQRIAGLGSYDLDFQTGRWSSSEVLDVLFGIDKEYARTYENWVALIYPGDRAMMEAFFADEIVRKGAAFNREYRIVRHTDHAERWMHGLGRLEFDTRGRPLRMFGTIQDITERRRAEEQLRLAASVFTHTHEGIMITSADGAILDVNDAFTQITGYGRKEVLGGNPRLLKSGRQSKEFYSEMWRALTDKGYWSGELWNRSKDGRIFCEALTISAVRDSEDNVQRYVALFSDITSSKERESKLEHFAHFDALTGLPNRVLLSDRLSLAMSQAHRRKQLVAVAYLDLDGFKEVNDLYGHNTGDQLLMYLSRRMKKALRKGDTLARLGGDEFVAVFLDLPEIKAIQPELARLLAVVSHPVKLGNIVLQVSASIGVSFYPQAEDVDADQLLRQSDQAMYRAKLDGKNRYYIFDHGYDLSICAPHESLQRIPQA